MAPSNTGSKQAESKIEAEALIPQFQFSKILNQDQNGRRIHLLGQIHSKPALLTLERAAFPAQTEIISTFLTTLTDTVNLGTNDVYRWYMSNHSAPAQTSPVPSNSAPPAAPALKLNLIYPATETHIRKYTAQVLRSVTETPDIYRRYIRPYVERHHRTPKRLDWIYNILDGVTEQDDVVYRSPDFGRRELDRSPTGGPASKGGFLLLPDLNWDRKTLTGLHLLALVERRDVWSLRDLKKSDTPWLRSLRAQALKATSQHGTDLGHQSGQNETEMLEEDEIKCYVHYQPTYYHFHVHLVHVMLEPEGTTQSAGKAILLDTLISWLESMPDTDQTGEEMGLDQVDVSYFLGEQSDLWQQCFTRLKQGQTVDLGL